MSWKIQSRVWKEAVLKGSELTILLALADFANDQGIAWPSVASLAAKCRLTKRRVQEVLRKLAAIGEISIQFGGKGARNTNHYHLDRYLPGMEDCSAQTQGEPEFTLPGDKGEAGNTLPASKDEPGFTLRVNSTAPNPLINPQKPEAFQAPTANGKNGSNGPAGSKRPPRKVTSDPLLENAAVSCFRGLVHLTPNPTQRKLIGEQVTDVHAWEEAILHWLGHGWNPKNVFGMLDFYRAGGGKSCRMCAGKLPKQFIVQRPVEDVPHELVQSMAKALEEE